MNADAEQVSHIYALIGGAPLASLGELPPPSLGPIAGNMPHVMDSVKSFQARSQASSACRKLAPGRNLKEDAFPLSALSPVAAASSTSYFEKGDPILRTEALGPAVAEAQLIERLRLGGPILQQQMEEPTPESFFLDEASGRLLPAAQLLLKF